MKKRVFFLLMCILFIYSGKVNAVNSTCPTSEQASLNSELASIKITYEEQVDRFNDDTGMPIKDGEDTSDMVVFELYSFNIFILNMTENVYVEVTNDYNSDSMIFRYEDAKDGVISFKHDSEMMKNIVKYTFTFYSSDKTSCPGDKYAIRTVTIPRYNSYSMTRECEGHEELKSCKKYVTWKDEGEKAFFKKVENELKNSKKGNDKKEDGNVGTQNTIFEDKKGVLLVSGCVLVIIAGAIIITKKRKGSAQ